MGLFRHRGSGGQWLFCDGHLLRIVVLEGIHKQQLQPYILLVNIGIEWRKDAKPTATATVITAIPAEMATGWLGILFFEDLETILDR